MVRGFTSNDYVNVMDYYKDINEMLKAMGIKEPVCSITVRLDVNGLNTVVIERLLTQREQNGLVGWLRRRFGVRTKTESVPLPVD